MGSASATINWNSETSRKEPRGAAWEINGWSDGKTIKLITTKNEVFILSARLKKILAKSDKGEKLQGSRDREE